MHTGSMLSMARRAFNPQEQECRDIRKTIFEDQEAAGGRSEAIGLRILTHGDRDQYLSNTRILLKRPAFTRTSRSAAASSAINSSLGGDGTRSDEYFCFLKDCCLCRAPLRQDKDIYMYRGDQGFCSVECRNRQIVSDETAEIARRNRTRRRPIVSPPQDYCHAAGQHCSETRKLLQDMRQRRKNRLLLSQTNQSPLVPLVHSLFL